MRDLLARLRAALTPQAAALLCALLMLVFVAAQRNGVDREGTELEERLEHALLGMEGVENVSVVINTRVAQADSGMFDGQKKEEMPVGAIAVMQGEDDPVLQLEIQEAICVLLGLPASSVSVMMGGIQ